MQVKSPVKAPQQPRKVFIAVNLGENAGRRILAGILRYVNSGCRWKLNIANDFTSLGPDLPQRLGAADVDGVIGGLPELSGAFASLLSSSLPFVLNTSPENLPVSSDRIRRTTFVDVDNVGIGRKAFEYLSRLGSFRSIAFVSDRAERTWSVNRETAFTRDWKARGVRVHVFKTISDNRPFDPDELDAFLKSLPKPTAVWCVYDITALAVLEACKRCRIKVPQQLTVLSTDNDETLCRYATPTLSSIDLPQEHLGYLSAEALDRLMSGRVPPQKTVLAGRGELQVVERESSRNVPPATGLISRALDYISANICYGITIADVAAQLGISRSLLDLRFREILNKSVGRTIQEERLREIKRRLAYSDATMAQIAASCAFSSPARLAHFFRHETGMSMRTYRQAERQIHRDVRCGDIPRRL